MASSSTAEDVLRLENKHRDSSFRTFRNSDYARHAEREQGREQVPPIEQQSLQISQRPRDRLSWRRSGISVGSQSSTSSVQLILVDQQEWLQSQQVSAEPSALCLSPHHQEVADVSLSPDPLHEAADRPDSVKLLVALRTMPGGHQSCAFSPIPSPTPSRKICAIAQAAAGVCSLDKMAFINTFKPLQLDGLSLCSSSRSSGSEDESSRKSDSLDEEMATQSPEFMLACLQPQTRSSLVSEDTCLSTEGQVVAIVHGPNVIFNAAKMEALVAQCQADRLEGLDTKSTNSEQAFGCSEPTNLEILTKCPAPNMKTEHEGEERRLTAKEALQVLDEDLPLSTGAGVVDDRPQGMLDRADSGVGFPLCESPQSRTHRPYASTDHGSSFTSLSESQRSVMGINQSVSSSSSLLYRSSPSGMSSTLSLRSGFSFSRTSTRQGSTSDASNYGSYSESERSLRGRNSFLQGQSNYPPDDDDSSDNSDHDNSDHDNSDHDKALSERESKVEPATTKSAVCEGSECTPGKRQKKRLQRIKEKIKKGRTSVWKKKT